MRSDENISLSRRSAVLAGSGLAAFSVLKFSSLASAADSPKKGSESHPLQAEDLPTKQIEEILRSDGRFSDGVLSFSQDRKDLKVMGPDGIHFKSAWEVNHEFAFQSPGKDKALVNGELALLAKEANPIIDQFIKHGLQFQAFHQHFFDLSPQIFHIHFRGIGNPLELARAVAAVVAVTGTPLPQKSAANSKTPLDKNKLEKILGGSAEVGDDGVVTVSIVRKETIMLDGVALKPFAGIAHTVAFQPLDGGKGTAVAPDFALIASEINPLIQIMREQGFTIHCLYNQETAENPQLYFSHQLAVGDAYELARKMRKGLERLNTKFKT